MEWIMPWLPSAIWIVLCIVFAVVEAMTAGIVSIWFVGGSIVALIASFLGAPVWLQIVLCLGVSVGLLAGCRRMFPNSQASQKLEAEMSLDNVVGKMGYVSEEIKPGKKGLVCVDGVQWTARTVNNDECLAEDTKIVVCKKDGVICIVEAID